MGMPVCNSIIFKGCWSFNVLDVEILTCHCRATEEVVTHLVEESLLSILEEGFTEIHALSIELKISFMTINDLYFFFVLQIKNGWPIMTFS